MKRSPHAIHGLHRYIRLIISLTRRKRSNHVPGSNPYVYPAVDWMSTLFKNQNDYNRFNFNASGGSQFFAKYYMAGSYSRDNGILQVNPVKISIQDEI